MIVTAALAATRLVRAWKYEQIGEAPREKVLDWLDRPVMKQQVKGQSRALDEVNIRATAAKEWLGYLLDCPHCLSVHLSIACILGLRFRLTRPVVQGLAAAMIASLIVQWMPGLDLEESFPAIRVRVMGDETAEKREP